MLSPNLLPQTTLDRLESTLDLIRNSQTIGVVAGINSPQGYWLGSSGSSSPPIPTAPTIELATDALFQIGSITKTFVAVAVMQLIEQGRLTLDSQLMDILPEGLISRMPLAKFVSIEQLLNHTSGIYNYAEPLFAVGANLFQEWSSEDLLGLVYDLRPYSLPGSEWHYSNTNYTLLGEVLETVTGQSISQVIRQQILDPLDLSNTFYSLEEPIPKPVTNAYWDIDNDSKLNDVSNLSLSWASSAGAIVSNAVDLEKFITGLFNGQLVSAQTLDRMLPTIETPNSRIFAEYGLGLAQLRTTQGTFYGHNGLTLGHRVNLWYSPTDRLTYVDLGNTRVFTNFADPLITALSANIRI